MNEDLSLLDATAQAELVRTGEVTPVELAEAAIERIEALNPALNAVVTPVFDRALDAARAGPAGPFAGVPYLLKDLVCEMEGVRFTEGSRFLAGHVSAFDHELVVRLRRAGLVILGKTNTPEFGMAPTCEPVLFGPARNPWDTGRSTSGSSGGSAAAVASGMVPFAHGNDLGGSLRYPASACGLFALKPTRARNPLGPEYGDVAAGGAVEHALTRTVRDSAALLDATSGPAPGDPYWAPPPARPFAAEVGADPGRLRIAYTTRTADGDPGHPDCVAAAEHAARLCASLGHEVTEADWSFFTPETGAAIGVIIYAATAWILRYWIRRLGREPGPGELEPLTRVLWEAGEKVTAAEWLLAVEDIQRFSRVVARFFTTADVFLTPTMSAPPLPIGTMYSTPEDPWRSLRISGQTVRYAGVVANLTGNPAMSVPLWWNDEGLPIGVHFLGRFGDEATLLRLASQLEAAQPWAARLPAVHAANPRTGCIRTATAVSGQLSAEATVPPHLTVSEIIQGVHMGETSQVTHTAHAKDEFFAGGMHMFRLTGVPQPADVLTRKLEAPPGARLDVWPTDPASNRHIPGPGADGVAFSTPSFSVVNSGNRTLRTPKRSWKITLEDTAGGAGHLAGMTCINLKSMYNDPSQMREALAWRLFRRAGIPAARHTYAKLAFDATYYGLYSVIEQVDKRFLKDHFGGNHRGNLYKAYCGDVGCATLEHRAGPDGDDSGRQYYRAAADGDRTYRLKTNEDDPGANTYDDLAQFIRTINGIGLGGGDGRFDTDAFRESVDGIMNARAFLRWAAVNVLLGSWDNYYATPSNYYLYNSGRLGAEDDFMQSPYFTFIPWDYDNCLGIDYFGTKWQYTDILDWPSNTRHYWRDRATSRIPLVQNLLRNRDYRQYYLDYLECLLDTEFNPDAFGQQIAAGSGGGLWDRVSQAAYLESTTPYGQPFTGRQFTNDEVYLSGCKQNELRHGQEKAEGIIHYVRMRHDSARQQLEQLRKQTPSATDRASFPDTMESLPAAA